MTDYPDCTTCWWTIEPDGQGGWRHLTDRAELAPDDWMCNDPKHEERP